MLSWAWRSVRLSSFPLGFFGSASVNTTFFGVLKPARCKAQCASTVASSSAWPGLGTTTATTASTQYGCGTPTTATSLTCGRR